MAGTERRDEGEADRLLRAGSVFSAADAVERLADGVRDFAAGTVIFRQGDLSDGVHFLVDGVVRIVIDNDAGTRETRLVAGQLFGELGSLRSARRAGSAIADTPVRTLFLDREHFATLHQTDPKLAAWVRDLERIYAIPNRGIVSMRHGEAFGQPAVTSVFRLQDGRTVTASKVVGAEIFVLEEHRAIVGDTLHWSAGDLRRELTVADGRITAVVCHGHWAELGQVCERALDGTALDPSHTARFRAEGQLEPASRPPAWSPGSMLCNCMRVTRAVVAEAITAGCTEIEAVSQATGAGSVCGGCWPRIDALLRG